MYATKERILTAALRLFAKDGYEGVSVSMISGEVRMTKGALYKHFSNKRDIFDSIIVRMEERDAERAKDFEMPEGKLTDMTEKYRTTSIDQMIEYSKAQFSYWTRDTFAASFRRMLTLEQYRSPEMGRLYQQYLVLGPLGYVTDIFSSLGIGDPRNEAVRFYAPMFLLISADDGKGSQDETMSQIEYHFELERKRLKKIIQEK